MKKLVIIGANDFQNQLILKAKSLGYETHVFAWEDGAVGKDNADYFYPISIIEKDKILEKCKELCDYLIVAVCGDDYVTQVKKKTPAFTEEERIRIIGALKCVD